MEQIVEEYIFIDNIKDFYQLKAATAMAWAFKLSSGDNKIDKNSVFIFANVSGKINDLYRNYINQLYHIIFY